MNKLSNVLLGATFLTAVSAMPALAVPFDEDTDLGMDFPNSADGTLLAANVDDVTGRLDSELDLDNDFFTFTGLTPNASFWLTFFDFEDAFSGEVPLRFTVDGGAPVTPGVGNTAAEGMFAGNVLADGQITIRVSPSNFLEESETYRVTLEIHAVPEPATLALFGIGVAGLAAARRRRKAR